MFRFRWIRGFVLLCVAAALNYCWRQSQPDTLVAASEPSRLTAEVLQELHDLQVEINRLKLRNQLIPKLIELHANDRAAYEAEQQQSEKRIAEIHERLQTIHDTELGEFERVAVGAGLECSEETSYAIILCGRAGTDIAKNELLLFHACSVYRTTGTFERLSTNGVGFYFRPNREIASGSRFRITCIQDAPEEIENVKQGYMPDSDRARDPSRAYETRVQTHDSK